MERCCGGMWVWVWVWVDECIKVAAVAWLSLPRRSRAAAVRQPEELLVDRLAVFRGASSLRASFLVVRLARLCPVCYGGMSATWVSTTGLHHKATLCAGLCWAVSRSVGLRRVRGLQALGCALALSQQVDWRGESNSSWAEVAVSACRFSNQESTARWTAGRDPEGPGE